MSSRFSASISRLRHSRCGGYVLLEVVIATGLLVVALAVIGGQIQDSGTSIHRMERRLEAIRLAEQQFAYLDLGLVELDSVDEIEEGDFGSRFPDWGWRLITEPTAVEGMFRLKLEVLHSIREEAYREDDFPWDEAELVYSAYSLRAAPQKINLAADFGLTEDELAEFAEKMEGAGLPIDPSAIPPSYGLDAPFEDFIAGLPVLLEAMGIDIGDLEALIPPELLQQLKDEGLLGGEEDEGEEDGS